MANEYKEVRAKTGEDRDGKAIYRTIGRVLTTKAGPMLKLDSVPLMWDGWAYISDPKPKDEAPVKARGKIVERGAWEDASDSPPF